jgi:hypothetical protein
MIMRCCEKITVPKKSGLKRLIIHETVKNASSDLAVSVRIKPNFMLIGQADTFL